VSELAPNQRAIGRVRFSLLTVTSAETGKVYPKDPYV